MHVGEAFLPRAEAIELARAALRSALNRNAVYYAKKPELQPDPERVVEAAIRADDAWIYVPFARASGSGDPLVVRVNGITKVALLDRSF